MCLKVMITACSLAACAGPAMRTHVQLHETMCVTAMLVLHSDTSATCWCISFSATPAGLCAQLMCRLASAEPARHLQVGKGGDTTASLAGSRSLFSARRPLSSIQPGSAQAAAAVAALHTAADAPAPTCVQERRHEALPAEQDALQGANVCSQVSRAGILAWLFSGENSLNV